jgi:hypothetical protein
VLFPSLLLISHLHYVNGYHHGSGWQHCGCSFLLYFYPISIWGHRWSNEDVFEQKMDRSIKFCSLPVYHLMIGLILDKMSTKEVDICDYLGWSLSLPWPQNILQTFPQQWRTPFKKSTLLAAAHTSGLPIICNGGRDNHTFKCKLCNHIYKPQLGKNATAYKFYFYLLSWSTVLEQLLTWPAVQAVTWSSWGRRPVRHVGKMIASTWTRVVDAPKERHNQREPAPPRHSQGIICIPLTLLSNGICLGSISQERGKVLDVPIIQITVIRVISQNFSCQRNSSLKRKSIFQYMLDACIGAMVGHNYVFSKLG